MVFSSLGREALRIVLPSWCVVCDEQLPWRERIASCCRRCWSSLPRIDGVKCVSCALPLPVEENGLCCIRCQRDPLPVDWCETWGHYRGAMEHVLHAFKFGRHDFLADELSRLMETAIRAREDVAFDAVVPVPMHKAKLRRRGYNQAELLARSLARRLGISCRPEMLKKVTERETQSQLHRRERAANVRNAFAAAGVAGSILLVDDISTTGETLRECAAVLRRAGAGRVCAAVVAKVT